MNVRWQKLIEVVLGCVMAMTTQNRSAGESPGQELYRAFTRAPKVGEKAPDIQLYDAEGRPFRLGQLRGHYTVLVFGCLT
ncbi:MAG: hypothetical protein FJ276_10445 [Planctomycetes bacterium]|nr:hypothetical protein [Planctomycetota bacterium]